MGEDWINKMKQEELEDMYNLEKEHWWFKSKRKIIKYFIKKYGKPGSLLDIGCGTGITLLELKDSFEVFGVDNSKIALEFCKKRGLNNLKLSPAEKLPFKDESFDNILALDMGLKKRRNINSDSARFADAMDKTWWDFPA